MLTGYESFKDWWVYAQIESAECSARSSHETGEHLQLLTIQCRETYVGNVPSTVRRCICEKAEDGMASGSTGNGLDR